MKKQLKILALAFSLTACASLPDKPTGQICTIDLPRLQLICAPIGNAETVHDLFSDQMFTRDITKIPLSDADKYIAFSPDSWANVHIYLKKLETIVKNNCK